AARRSGGLFSPAVALFRGARPFWGAPGGGPQRRPISATTVFSGMLVATVVGIVFIPALFVLFQRLREWGHGLTDSSPTAHSASAPEKSASRHRR
ncbi:hypothetical protein, partial [Enterobacter hormaechei]|uniref:hypothetical protein n=1 Tax=Enterobacter hormaechei TaxID=158836 RepID=UPI0039B6F719